MDPLSDPTSNQLVTNEGTDESVPVELSREQYDPQGREAQIDVDTSSGGDNDSSLGSDESTADSASITSSIMGYKYENGRRYHAFREGRYILPNDEMEQDRMDLHHHLYRLLLGGTLSRAPIPEDVQRVMDYGTGTGIWAIDFADEHPSAYVVGTDLSPIQPEWLPPNCKFYVDDIESDWVFRPEEAFDYIHGRSMCGSISDFDSLYQKAFENLKPGGWIELQEFEAWIWQIDDPESKRIPKTTRWLELLDEASSKIGRRCNVATEQRDRLRNAGFINVRDDVYPVPVGPWPKDKRMKELGIFQRENMLLCLEPYTFGLLARVLKWSVEECQVIMAEVNSELRDKDNHMISYFHFIYGQKPPLADDEQG